MNKNNKILILTVILLLLLTVAITVGILVGTRSGKDACQHVYGNFTLEGTPDYDTPAKAQRTCTLCNKTETLSVYAATGLEYETDDEGITTIVNADGFQGKYLYIASVTKDGTPVDAIAEAVFSEKSFDALYIEEGIQTIQNDAFSFCGNLKQVTLPASITAYGDYTFAGCKKLDTVTWAKGASKLGVNQFYECTALTEITLPDTIDEIPSGTFFGCANLRQIDLPENLTAIGGHAFSACVKLSGIEFPANLKEIYPESFAGCVSLVSLKLPALQNLYYSAFLGCTGLKTVYLPKEIQNIDVNGADGPFFCCSEELVLYTDAAEPPKGWEKHFESYNSAVADDDGGELSDDAYFNLSVIYNCNIADFPGK